MADKIYSQTVSEAGLDALYIIEGHFNGAVRPKRQDGTLDPWTTYYGVTEAGLSNVRQLKRKGVPVPDYLMKATVHTLTKNQAREAAGFNMMYLERELDSVYKDDDFKFSQLPVHIKSGVLSVVYNGGLQSYKNGYKNGNVNTSVLRAAKTGSRERINLALLNNGKAGDFLTEPAASDTRGRSDRVLSGVKMTYDTDNHTFKDVDTRDAAYKRWKANPHTVKQVVSHLMNIEAGNIVKNYTKANLDRIASATSEPIAMGNNESQEEKPLLAKADMSDNNTLDLTNESKNLFTKNEEIANATNGNKDVNMQQSSGPLG